MAALRMPRGTKTLKRSQKTNKQLGHTLYWKHHKRYWTSISLNMIENMNTSKLQIVDTSRFLKIEISFRRVGQKSTVRRRPKSFWSVMQSSAKTRRIQEAIQLIEWVYLVIYPPYWACWGIPSPLYPYQLAFWLVKTTLQLVGPKNQTSSIVTTSR